MDFLPVDFLAEVFLPVDFRPVDLRPLDFLPLDFLPLEADFRPPFLAPPRLRGTFAPFSLASDRPIAIACFLLVTFLPLRPLRSVPFLRRFIADSTLLLAAFPYFLPPDFFAAITTAPVKRVRVVVQKLRAA